MTISQPYAVNEIRDAQWLVSMMELYLLEHGHTQQQVNAWIISQLIDTPDSNTNKDTDNE